MAVKHISTGIVHSGTKSGTTGCGTDTKENPSHLEILVLQSLVIKTVVKTNYLKIK